MSLNTNQIILSTNNLIEILLNTTEYNYYSFYASKQTNKRKKYFT